jgi:hypothetical protein
MNRIRPKHPRILAIAPSTRGFGFAVLEGKETLADWGARTITRDKNTRSIAKVEELITHYQPEVMVLQDHSTADSRRPVRIQVLSREIIDLAPGHNVSVALFSRKQIDRVFFADGKGTKHARAEIIAGRFPDELGFQLPPERRAWMKEDARMDIFDAVALALMLRVRRLW